MSNTKKQNDVDYWENYYASITKQPVGSLENISLVAKMYADRFIDETSLFGFLLVILISLQFIVFLYVCYKLLPYALDALLA